MVKTTFLTLGATSALALSLFPFAVHAQTTPPPTTPDSTAPTPMTADAATPMVTPTPGPPVVVAPLPKVPRQLHYVKLKNAPVRTVALQLGWLNSGPSYGEVPTPETSAPGPAHLKPEVLYFLPVESPNALVFYANDEEAKTLTEKIKALDVKQPRIRVEVRVYEPKSADDVSALFASAQPGTTDAMLRPIDESVLTEHARLVSSQTLETSSGKKVDLSTEKLLKDAELDWQLQTTATPDGQLTLRVSKDAQIQTVQNLAPATSGQLLALSTDAALQKSDAPRQLVVFVPTIEGSK